MIVFFLKHTVRQYLIDVQQVQIVLVIQLIYLQSIKGKNNNNNNKSLLI